MKTLGSVWLRVWIKGGARFLAVAISVVVAVALVVAASLWAFAGKASAEFIGDGQYVRGVGAENSYGFWLGALATATNLGTDEPSYCVSMWNHSPGMAMPATGTLVESTTVAAPSELALTPEQMAYLLGTYHFENGAYSRAALAFLAHMNFEQSVPGHDTAESVQRLYVIVREQKPQVYDTAVEYVEAARVHAPLSYEAGVLTGGAFEGKIEGVGVKSATGWVSGIPLELRLEGAAVFASTGTQQWVGTTQEQPLSLPWKVSADGNVSATVTFPQTARQTLTLAQVGGGYQDLLTLAMRPENDPVSRTIRLDPIAVYEHFQPMIRTNVAQSMVVDTQDGHAKISDEVEVLLPEGEQWPTVQGKGAELTLRGTVYSLKEPLLQGSPSVPDEAQSLAEVSLTVNSPGRYRAEAHVAHHGFVTWVWKIQRDEHDHRVLTDQGKELKELIRSDWQDPYGLLDETTSIRHRLEVDSAVSVRETRSGAYLVDDLFVKGFPADHGGFAGRGEFAADQATMRQELYFFPRGLEVTEENLPHAQHVAGVDIPATTGFHSSVGDNAFHVLEGNPVGVYVFVTSFAGDARVAPYRSDVTDSHEWYVVGPPPEGNTPEPEPGTTPPPVDENPKAVVPHTPPSDTTPPQPEKPLKPREERGILPTPLARTGLAGQGAIGLGVAVFSLGLTLRVLHSRRRELM